VKDEPGAGLVTPAMRAIVGQVLRRQTAYPIAASDIRRWAIAVYYPDSPPARFLGGGAAAGGAPLVAPEEFNPFAWAVAEGGLERDNIAATSIEELAGIAAPPLAVIINGGCRTAYGVPMREGDTIRSTLSLASYAVKQGKGGPLLITETDEVWTNQSGEMVREARLTVVRY
jgi:hypothetical protein